MTTYLVMDSGTLIEQTPDGDHALGVAKRRRAHYKPEFQHLVTVLAAEKVEF